MTLLLGEIFIPLQLNTILNYLSTFDDNGSVSSSWRFLQLFLFISNTAQTRTASSVPSPQRAGFLARFSSRNTQSTIAFGAGQFFALISPVAARTFNFAHTTIPHYTEAATKCFIVRIHRSATKIISELREAMHKIEEDCRKYGSSTREEGVLGACNVYGTDERWPPFLSQNNQ